MKTGSKYALILVNSNYTDSGFAKLSAPTRDAEEFARVLKAPEIAAFDDVITLVDDEYSNAIREIDRFFSRRTIDDLLVFYFSGHGVRDENGALYLAVKDTERNLLRSTAIKSDFLRDAMDQCRSKRQILILDCCNSGAFARGSKAGSGTTMGTGPAFEGSGYGHVVLTASDEIQFAWEGDQVTGETTNSLFTHFLVKGMEGEADHDNDGKISITELYEFIHREVVSRTKKQTPGKWAYKEQGEIVIVNNPNRRTKDLPQHILQLIKNPLPQARILGAQQLGELLDELDVELVGLVRSTLEILKKDDNQSVALAASDLLSQSKKPVRRNTKRTTRVQNPEIVNASGYFQGQTSFLSRGVYHAAYSDGMAWILASLSHLSYDRFEEGGKDRDLLTAKLAGGGFTLVDSFASPETDTQALLVTNGVYAVLAFRGTEVRRELDIRTDARGNLRAANIEARVNAGFKSAYHSVEEEIEMGLNKVRGFPLYITGHSLGGALAIIAAQNLERHPVFKDQIAACYTFGSPRVGVSELDVNFTTPIYRIVNTSDIVTLVPSLAMGYVHVGDVRFLGSRPGEIRHGIPVLQRTFLFLMAMFKLFGPLVADHAIVNYRNKLQAVALRRNPALSIEGQTKVEK